MIKQKTYITYTDAFKKYFGGFDKHRYPFTCVCGAEFLHIDVPMWEHLQFKHEETPVSEKMLVSLEKRRKDAEIRQAEKAKKHSVSKNIYG